MSPDMTPMGSALSHNQLSVLQSLFVDVLILSLRNCRILVLLVLANEIVHIALCLSELHLVHPLTGVPMQEGLAPEHSCELIPYALEQLLDRRRVANEGRAHFEAARWDGAESCLDIVGDPLDEVGVVPVLDIAHLVLDFFHRDFPPEDSAASEVAAIAEVGGCHHIAWVEHLLSKFWDSDSTEGVGATASQRSKADHEEMETWEGDQIDGKFAEVRVELPRETEASCNTRHNSGNKVVQVPVGGVRQSQGSHTNIIESFIVNTEGLVRVLNQLMD